MLGWSHCRLQHRSQWDGRSISDVRAHHKVKGRSPGSTTEGPDSGVRQAGAAVFDCLIEKGPVPCDRLPVNHWHLGTLVSVSGGRTPPCC